MFMSVHHGSLIKSSAALPTELCRRPGYFIEPRFVLRRSATSRWHPLASLTRASVIARLQYLLARTLRVHHDDLEEILEVGVEKLHQRLSQFGTRPARPRLQRRNIVLANAEVVRQLALRQTLFLAHRP